MTKVRCGAVCLMLLILAAPAGAKTAAAKPAAKPAVRAGLTTISRDPYVGMIAIEAPSGKVLVEDNADAVVYPASVTKLMDMLLLLERIEQGTLHLTDQVQVTAEASRIGGSQVYLKEHEVFTVEEMLYALMVQSANDCATALAIHTAGSTDAFVALMNQKAQALGMTHTHYYSCHGLPPTPPRTPQEVDVSTARDLAILARELLLNHPEVLRYTSTVERPFRNGSFIMRNHNRLLRTLQGVDGLKTGYFPVAGYSVAATAKHDGRRVIVVVAGSQGRLGFARDKAATEVFARAFAALPPPPRTPTNVVVAAFSTNALPDPTTTTPQPPPPPKAPVSHLRWYAVVGGVLGVLVVGAGAVAGLMAWKRRQDENLTVGGSSSSTRGRLPFQR